MKARTRQFVSPVYATKLFFTNDDELFIKTKITFFANVAIGFTFL